MAVLTLLMLNGSWLWELPVLFFKQRTIFTLTNILVPDWPEYVIN